MFVKLLPNQVVTYWKAIKFAAVKAEQVADGNKQLFLNRLLQDLLSSKAQCFVRLDDDRQIKSILITRIVLDGLTGERILFINTLYGFNYTPIEVWKEDYNDIEEFAKLNRCKKIVTWTSNSRICDIVTEIGFQERTRSFMMEV